MDDRFRLILESICEEGNKASNTIDDVLTKIVEECGEVAGEIVTITGNKPKKDYDPNIEIKVEIADLSLAILDYIIRCSDNKTEAIDTIIEAFDFNNRGSYIIDSTKLLIHIQYDALILDFISLLKTCAEIKFRYYVDKKEFLEYLEIKLEKWKSYKK